MSKSKLPKTDSIQELARFWDTHDVTDFEDELEEVTDPVFGLRTAITVHLQEQEADAIHPAAESKGVADEGHVRTWVLEKLEAGGGTSSFWFLL